MYTYRGSTYIELLICLLLFECMLAGMDIVQVKSTRSIANSYYFSAATQQLKNISNRLAVKSSSYTGMIEQWNKQNAIILPEGFGVVQDFHEYKIITLYWNGTHSENCSKDNNGEARCVQLRIPNSQSSSTEWDNVD